MVDSQNICSIVVGNVSGVFLSRGAAGQNDDGYITAGL